MLCDNCHNKEANVHLIQIVNGQKKETHLCDVCSKEKGEALFAASMDFGGDQFDLSNIISGIMGLLAQKQDEDVNLEYECPNCGMKYNEFKKTALLGCDKCYSNFQSLLQPVITRIQGKIEHTGKIPDGQKVEFTNKRRMIKLKDELRQAITLEEFERAAEIRDEIKKIQNEL